MTDNGTWVSCLGSLSVLGELILTQVGQAVGEQAEWSSLPTTHSTGSYPLHRNVTVNSTSHSNQEGVHRTERVVSWVWNQEPLVLRRCPQNCESGRLDL